MHMERDVFNVCVSETSAGTPVCLSVLTLCLAPVLSLCRTPLVFSALSANGCLVKRLSCVCMICRCGLGPRHPAASSGTPAATGSLCDPSVLSTLGRF